MLGVLRHSFAFEVAEPQVILGRDIPLLCSLAIPRHALREVHRHAFAFFITAPQVELGCGVPLIRGLAQPVGRLREVLRHAFSLAVHHPEAALGHRVPAFSLGTQIGLAASSEDNCNTADQQESKGSHIGLLQAGPGSGKTGGMPPPPASEGKPEGSNGPPLGLAETIS